MKEMPYIELILCTLQALDIEIEEWDKKPKFVKPTNTDQSQKIAILTKTLTLKKIEVLNKIESYKEFTTHKNKLFLTLKVSDEYYSFKQYLTKFSYYSNKYQKSKRNSEEDYILAIKSLLLVEYFIKNFNPKTNKINLD
jgi:hypothetical protein